MKDNPLIISLLIGLIVVLVIAGVSLLVKTKSLSEAYKETSAKNINLEKEVETIRTENAAFDQTVAVLNNQMKELKDGYEAKITALKDENLRLDTLKEKLEDNLKDELMKEKLQEGQ